MHYKPKSTAPPLTMAFIITNNYLNHIVCFGDCCFYSLLTCMCIRYSALQPQCCNKTELYCGYCMHQVKPVEVVCVWTDVEALR